MLLSLGGGGIVETVERQRKMICQDESPRIERNKETRER